MTSTVAEKINSYFSRYPKRTYPKGQILIFSGEGPEHIFYIVKGRVREYDVSYRGDEVVVNVFKPPAFFPLSWALNRSPNRFLYKTETDTTLHAVPVNEVVKFVEANPDVMLDLLRRLYKGLDGVLGRMVHLMSGTATSRLLYELVIECRRFGKKNADGSYTLSANEGDIAARSGLSRETISRILHNMKKDGLVKVDSRGIHLKNLASLEKKLGSEV